MDLSVLICAQQAGLVQLGITVWGEDLNWVASSRHQFEEMGSGWLKLVEAHLQNGTTPRIALHPFVSNFVQTSEEQTFNFHFKTNREGNESMRMRLTAFCPNLVVPAIASCAFQWRDLLQSTWYAISWYFFNQWILVALHHTIIVLGSCESAVWPTGACELHAVTNVSHAKHTNVKYDD